MRSISLTPAVNAILPRAIVPGIILAHLVITIVLSNTLNIWYDEAYSLQTTQYDIGYALTRAINFEEQPPLYFMLLNLWRNINDSYVFARLFSVLCTTLTLIIFANISRTLVKDLHPGWLTAVVAFNPSILWAATEIRCYAFVILISTLLCKLFGDAYLSDHPTIRIKWYYTMTAIVALYTFYFLGFLLVANACALLLLKRWRAFRAYLFSMIIVAICFAPMIWMVTQQIVSNTTTAEVSVSFLQGLNWIGNMALSFITPGKRFLLNSPRQLIFWISIVLILSILFRKHNIIITSVTTAFLLIAPILWIFMFIILVGAHIDISDRHILFIYPPLILCVLFVIMTVTGKKGVMACFLIMLGLSAQTCIWGWPTGITKFPRTKWGEWDRVAAYIMEAEKQEQPILVYRSEAVLPLGLYYSGKNALIPLPKQANVERYDLIGDGMLKDEGEITQILLHHLNDSQNFWLITDTLTTYRGITFGHELLLHAINHKYHIVSTKEFHGSTVRFIQKKPPESILLRIIEH
ncbi:membrane protein-like protein [Candidatus Moduliflexus flocculans]|uniref:Membrane protein-like protein n=1 Tax=Candidatus Moduliflexus flocculans TaxID=1499966 RepID=A0A0S6W339_9BACT|nr:membrane protein-like protein [Candidatus Moduliflexus flocculans]